MQINSITGQSSVDYTQATENIRQMYNGRTRMVAPEPTNRGQNLQTDPILSAKELPDGLLPADGMRAPFDAKRISSQGERYLMRVCYA